jgi:hypothetical protein
VPSSPTKKIARSQAALDGFEKLRSIFMGAYSLHVLNNFAIRI